MKLKADLLRYFQTKHPFLNPELSLRDVAQMLGISHYTLSRFINKEFGVNFYTLVSGYRVEYVLHLIELNRHTMNGDMLFAASGFKSRTVFFEQFKEKTAARRRNTSPKSRKRRRKKEGRKRSRCCFRNKGGAENTLPSSSISYRITISEHQAVAGTFGFPVFISTHRWHDRCTIS